MNEATAEEVTKEVFDLFREYGSRDYIGEPVSQQEHMTQCAMLAEKEGYPIEVILGVFLHDIGHLVGMKNDFPCMGEVGTQNHEIVGEKFLKDLGFPQTVTSFVRGHVEAKRYLVFKYPNYYDKVGSYVNASKWCRPVVRLVESDVGGCMGLFCFLFFYFRFPIIGFCLKFLFLWKCALQEIMDSRLTSQLQIIVAFLSSSCHQAVERH